MIPEYYKGKVIEYYDEIDKCYCLVSKDDYSKSMGEITNEYLGVLWRLSAPGYLDCTDWCPADDIRNARKMVVEMYNVDPFSGEDLGDYHDSTK
jgi:flavoprotein